MKTLPEIITELEASLKEARKDQDRSEEKILPPFFHSGEGHVYEHVLELLKNMKPSPVWVVSWVMDRDPDTPMTSLHASKEGAEKFLTEHLSEYTNCEKAKELLATGELDKAVDAHNDWIFQGRDGWVYDLQKCGVEP